MWTAAARYSEALRWRMDIERQGDFLGSESLGLMPLMKHRLKITPSKEPIVRRGEDGRNPRRHHCAPNGKAVGGEVVLRHSDDPTMRFTALLKLAMPAVEVLPIGCQNNPTACSGIANLFLIRIIARSLRLRGDDTVPACYQHEDGGIVDAFIEIDRESGHSQWRLEGIVIIGLIILNPMGDLVRMLLFVAQGEGNIRERKRRQGALHRREIAAIPRRHKIDGAHGDTGSADDRLTVEDRCVMGDCPGGLGRNHWCVLAQ